jgi:hypothetical protein
VDGAAARAECSTPHGGTKLCRRRWRYYVDVYGKDFSRVLTDYGYRLAARDPKYLDPLVQKYGPYPAFHFLFELKK